ncbi:hypothetical protein VMCG_04232 [Cytospora schulzeri]|uniref:Uncharacterized protein n=1 Tax=Cytospora schulzeri TaxID=448051 RepID=A0A423WT19_9PEZI|nr:hypothetical protein VMCG_04232 [Valsa malicola]
MFGTLIRRAAQETRRSNLAYIRHLRELHPPKKVWPPDFKRLSKQEQFRFEKKFKRRLALAMARPQRERLLKLVQLFSVTSVLIYTVLFMDWKTERHPFVGLRKSLWNMIGYDYEAPSTHPTTQKIHPQGLPQVK